MASALVLEGAQVGGFMMRGAWSVANAVTHVARCTDSLPDVFGRSGADEAQLPRYLQFS